MLYELCYKLFVSLGNLCTTRNCFFGVYETQIPAELLK